jgi:transposase
MIAVGVDTHKHQHVAVALDQVGQVLGEIAVAACGAGYRELVSWLAGLDGEAMVGIEGAGSYSAGLCRRPCRFCRLSSKENLSVCEGVA